MGVQLVFVLAGMLCIALVQFDIVATVLHPEIESPLSSRLQRLTRRFLGVIGGIIPRRRARMLLLNWSLPMMVAGLIMLWLLLLALGFALIYYPWIGDDRVFSSDQPLEQTLLNALYYSGVTLATLGYGDIMPLATPLRVLAVIEALAGAVTISFAVAYVLAVYPALARTRTIAAALDGEVAGQSNALPMVRRYLTQNQRWGEELATRLREIGMELVALTQDHETHPVLYYAHPRRVQHSFLRILVTAQNLVGLLRYGLSPDQHPDLVRHPHLLLLEEALHYSLRRLTASLHIPPVAEPNPDDERERLLADFAMACTGLERLGLVSARMHNTQPVPVLVETTISTDPRVEDGQQSIRNNDTVTYQGEADVFDPALDLASDSANQAYIAFRLETDPYIAAYAETCGYPLEVALADYQTTWWVGNR